MIILSFILFSLFVDRFESRNRQVSSVHADQFQILMINILFHYDLKSQTEVYVCHALSSHALTRVRLSELNMYHYGNKLTTF